MMRREQFFYALIGILCGFGAGCSSELGVDNPFDPEGTGIKSPGRIGGTIVLFGTSDQSGTTVRLIDSSGAEAGAPVTAEDGTFISADLSVGTYTVSVDVPADNFPIILNDVAVVPGITTDVGILTSAQAPPIGSIEGTVELQDTTDSPAGIRIIAARETDSAVETWSQFTDNNGNYLFTELPSGTYYLRADREGFTPDQTTVAVQSLLDGGGDPDAQTVSSQSTATLMRLYPASAVVQFASAYSNQADATLQLLAFGGINEMRLSEDPELTDAAWVPHEASRIVTLSAGEGTKTYYSQFRYLDENTIERLRSDVYAASLIFDQTAPSLVSFVLDPDAVSVSGVRYTTAPASAVPAQVEAVDERSPIVGVKLVAGGADPATVPYVSLSTESLRLTYLVSVAFSGGDGQKTIDLQLLDAAGNESLAVTRLVTIDSQAPTGNSITVTGQIGGSTSSTTLTRIPQVSLTLASTGATEMRIANDSGFAGASWQPFQSGPVAWQLTSGDDPSKTVFVEFRDPIGNATSAVQGMIALDTTSIVGGALSLDSGAAYAASASVNLAATAPESSWTVELSGGIDETGTYTLGGSPDPENMTVTLNGGDGLKNVTAVFYDDAGNPSTPVLASITLDTMPPADGTVTLAGGQAVVNTQVIAASVADTAPDTMYFWEAAGLGACGTPACTDSGFTAFVPSTTFTLSAGMGDKYVCWRFCDAAGNASNVGTQTIELDTYLDRPTPILTSINPTAHLALSSVTFPLTLVGRGIAYNTQALIGNFTLDCEGADPEEDCEADAGGACGMAGVCNTTCDTTCSISALPDDIMRNAGTYVVRLYTPDPVAGGVGTSTNTEFFNVIAPVPAITKMSPRGVVQSKDSDGTPIDAMPLVDVWGVDFMDNVQFRLGTNIGTIQLFEEDPPGTNMRHVQVQMSTAGLQPQHLTDYQLTAINPAPGGGTFAQAFGLNPEAYLCPTTSVCTSNMRRTRALAPHGRTSAQSYQFEAPSAGAMVWRGGSLAGLENADGTLLARVDAEFGSTIPLPLGTSIVTLESDFRTVGEPVTMRQATLRNDGLFGADVSTATEVRPQAFELTDINLDGYLDAVIANETSNSVQVFIGAATNLFVANYSYSTDLSPRDVAVGDLNSDGVPDVATMNASSSSPGISVRMGVGDGTLDPRVDRPSTVTPVDGVIADLNDDGAGDIVVCGSAGGSNGVSIRFGDGSGVLGNEQFVSTGSSSSPNRVHVADTNGDALPDLVVNASGNDEIVVLLGDTDATFATSVTTSLPATSYYPDLAVGDINNDGTPDAVALDGFDYDAGGGSNREYHLEVFLGDGDGSFTAASTITLLSTTTAFRPDQIELADVNADGYLDVAAALFFTDKVVVFPGNGDGTFGGNPLTVLSTGLPWAGVMGFTASGGANHFRMGDIGGDGAMDGVSTDFLGDIVMVAPGQGDNVVGAPTSVTAGSSAYKVALVDVDRDGDLDIFNANYNDPFQVHLGAGDGTFPSSASLSAASWNAHIRPIDADGDGRPDVIGLSSFVPRFYLYIGDGVGGFASGLAHQFRTGSTCCADIPWELAVGDLNYDGRPDVVGDIGQFRDVAIWYWTSGLSGGFYYGVTAEHLPDTILDVWTGSGTESIRLTDVDVDGDVDIVLPSRSNDVYFVETTGAGTFAAAVEVPFVPTGAIQSFEMRDINLDGIPDMVAGDRNADLLLVALGNGDFTFQTTQTYSMGENLNIVAAEDVNGDGLVDVIASDYQSESNNRLTVRLNDRAGGFGDPFSVDVGQSPVGIAVGDLDGNNVPDLVVANDGSGDISVVPQEAEQSWVQRLSDMPDASLDIPSGTTVFGAGTGGVHQRMQNIDELAVVVRIVGTNLEDLTVSLIPPSGGTPILLNDNLGCGPDWTGASVWQAHYPTTSTCATLSTLFGWQPSGTWQLSITNGGAAVAGLEHFEVVTRGSFVKAVNPGRVAASPEEIALPSGATGRMLKGWTLGYPDNVDLNCATTQGDADTDLTDDAGEHWYEFTLPVANTVSLRAVASFDAVLELRSGSCSGASLVACDDNSALGMNPELLNQALTAGTYCVIVDGVYATGSPNVAHVGEYELYVFLGAAIP